MSEPKQDELGLTDAFERPWAKESIVKCVPPGWQPLVSELLDDLLLIPGWSRCVHQVKEKFAALRFYTDGPADPGWNRIFMARIAEAEWRSQQLCMECGAYGKVHSVRGWMYVACKNHVEKDSDLASEQESE